MDNTHDNLTLEDTGIKAGAMVDDIASNVKNLFVNIRNNSKAKAAQKISDEGNYWTLREHLKGLIPIPQYIIDQVAGQGITESAIKKLPAQAAGASNSLIIMQLKDISGTLSNGEVNPTGNTTPGYGMLPPTIQKYIPYIIGVIVLAGIIYLISKKVK